MRSAGAAARQALPGLARITREKLTKGCPQDDHVLVRGGTETKVTVQLNCTVPVHVDKENFGLTWAVIVSLQMRGEKFRGGGHALISNEHDEKGAALIIRDSRWGILVVGDYARVMHASLSVRAGRRLVITGYCGGPILRNYGVL